MDFHVVRTLLRRFAAFSLTALQLNAQEPCRDNSDSAALADTLLGRAGEQFEDGERTSPMWAQVRRAVELAPLNHERLAFVLMLSRFANRPDSAIAFANLAHQRWPGCVMSDSAVIQAKAPPREQQPQRLPESYVLRGTVRDAATGAPLPDASIWPIAKRWGAVTDSAGNYELRWRDRGVRTFIVRHCDQRNLTTFPIEFFHDSIIRHDVSVPVPDAQICPKESRHPWAVDERDTTRFVGHYIYSWEGGGWLKACDGTTYDPDWDSKLANRLRNRKTRDGQVTFVRFRGRVVPDNIDTPPGLVRVNFPGPLFLVNKVEEVRDARPDDCR